MKVIAVVEQSEVMTKILHHLGMPTVPEGIAPARRPPRQLDLAPARAASRRGRSASSRIALGARGSGGADPICLTRDGEPRRVTRSRSGCENDAQSDLSVRCENEALSDLSVDRGSSRRFAPGRSSRRRLWSSSTAELPAGRWQFLEQTMGQGSCGAAQMLQLSTLHTAIGSADKLMCTSSPK